VSSSINTPPQIVNGSGIFGSQFNIISEALMQRELRYKSSYSNPASIELAIKHQKATKYGYKPKSEGKDKKTIRMIEK
jgi:hypothetical protein